MQKIVTEGEQKPYQYRWDVEPDHTDLNILVIEHEELGRAVVSYLRARGHNVYEAIDTAMGEDIIRKPELYADHPPEYDLVLSDDQTPGGLGSDLLEQLVSEKYPAHKALMSGTHDGERLSEEIAYLHKPFRMSELGKLLDNYLDQVTSGEYKTARERTEIQPQL